MGLVALELPEKTVAAQTSKWQAAHHPILFKLQRADQQVDFRFKPTQATLSINMIGPIPADVSAGDLIQYVDPNGVAYSLTITFISGNTLSISDISLTGTVYGGHVNYTGSRPNYFVETKVLIFDGSSALESIGTLTHKPDINGVVNINVSSWVRSYGLFENTFAYDQINKAIFGEGGKYKVQFRELYDGVDDPPFIALFGIRYWTNSAKQIQEAYGSNMADFVPTIDVTRNDKAKFLSEFEKPTYFVGYPFSLNFIYSDNLSNFEITREEEQFDINGDSLGTSSNTLQAAERFFVNRLMLEQGYTSDVAEVDVWLESGDALDGNPIEEIPPDPIGVYSDGNIFEPWLEMDQVENVSGL